MFINQIIIRVFFFIILGHYNFTHPIIFYFKVKKKKKTLSTKIKFVVHMIFYLNLDQIFKMMAEEHSSFEI